MSEKEKVEANTRLCIVIRQFPLIYNRSHRDYYNREAYDAAWSQISKIYHEPVKSCKKRWGKMRYKFMKTMRANKPCYKGELLNFLKPHLNDLGIPEFLRFRQQTSSLMTSDKANTDNVIIQTEESIDKREDKEKLIDENNDKGEPIDKENEKEKEKESEASRLAENEAKKSKSEKNIAEEIADDGRKEARVEHDRFRNPLYTQSKHVDICGGNEEYPIDITELPKLPKIAIQNHDDKDKEESDDDPFTELIEPRTRLSRACKRSLDQTPSDELQQQSQKEPEENRIHSATEHLRSRTKSTNYFEEKRHTHKQSNESANAGSKRPSSSSTRYYEETRHATKQNHASTHADSKKATDSSTFSQAGVSKMGEKAHSSARHSLTTQMPTHHSHRDERRHKSASSDTKHEARTRDTHKVKKFVNYGVQCDLKRVTTAPTDDDNFLNTLKPHLSKMNARQKLHFKKKIFESLMEVFDSEADFPPAKRAKLTETGTAVAASPSSAAATTSTASPISAEKPTQLAGGANGELSLTRELVAMMQAAKHTPELAAAQKQLLKRRHNENENLNGDNNSNDSDTSSESVVIVDEGPRIPHQSAVGPSTSHKPTAATTTTTTTSSATPSQKAAVDNVQNGSRSRSFHSLTSKQRRIVRKMLKMQHETIQTRVFGTNGDCVRRRVYRLLPSNETAEKSHASSEKTSGVNTLEDRTKLLATRQKLLNQNVTITSIPNNAPIAKSATATSTSTSSAGFQNVWVQAATTSDPRQDTADLNKSRNSSKSGNTTNVTRTLPSSYATQPNTAAKTSSQQQMENGAHSIARRYSICSDVSNYVEEHSQTYDSENASTSTTVAVAPAATTAKTTTTASRTAGKPAISCVDTRLLTGRVLPISGINDISVAKPRETPNYQQEISRLLNTKATNTSPKVVNSADTPNLADKVNSSANQLLVQRTTEPASTSVSMAGADAADVANSESYCLDYSDLIINDPYDVVTIKNEPLDCY